MTETQRNIIAIAVAFATMLGTAVAAYAVPVPVLRDVINDHWGVLAVWTGVTSAGWVAARFVYDWLPASA